MKGREREREILLPVPFVSNWNRNDASLDARVKVRVKVRRTEITNPDLSHCGVADWVIIQLKDMTDIYSNSLSKINVGCYDTKLVPRMVEASLFLFINKIKNKTLQWVTENTCSALI